MPEGIKLKSTVLPSSLPLLPFVPHFISSSSSSMSQLCLCFLSSSCCLSVSLRPLQRKKESVIVASLWFLWDFLSCCRLSDFLDFLSEAIRWAVNCSSNQTLCGTGRLLLSSIVLLFCRHSSSWAGTLSSRLWTHPSSFHFLWTSALYHVAASPVF